MRFPLILAHASAAQRRKIARRLEKSPLLKRELSEMAVESYGDAVLSAAALADALRDDIIWTDTDNDEPNTMAGFYACAA